MPITDLYGTEELSLEGGADEGQTGSQSPSQTRSSPGKHDASDTLKNGTSSEARSPTEKSPKDVTSPSKSSGESTPQLSYSAQIAKQFSSYKQTPSQERQQRSAVQGLPQPLGKTAPIASYESRTQNESAGQFGDRAVRPSEMKDEG